MSQLAEGAARVAAVRPFSLDVPEEKLADLRSRVGATVWPETETVTDRSQGVQLATMRALAEHWLSDYDWRRCEARLKNLRLFVTEIDDVDIHFIHVRSRHQGALPIIVTHGWPGSIIEQLKIIEPLTNPTELAAARWSPSMSSFRRCPATGSRENRPPPVGIPSASRLLGSRS
jgi:hypothetical protein